MEARAPAGAENALVARLELLLVDDLARPVKPSALLGRQLHLGVIPLAERLAEAELLLDHLVGRLHVVLDVVLRREGSVGLGGGGGG